MAEDIVQEATYPYPPSAVWRALTSGDAMGSWLMENTFREPVVGHKFQFRDRPRMGWSGVTDCEVVEVVPEKRLVYTWGAPEDDGFPPTKVTWELEAVGASSTRLRFRHTGFTGFKGFLMRAGMNNGWWRIIQRGIPFVVGEMQHGRMPTRADCKAHAKQAAKAKA